MGDRWNIQAGQAWPWAMIIGKTSFIWRFLIGFTSVPVRTHEFSNIRMVSFRVRLGSVIFTQTNVSVRLYHVVPLYKKGLSLEIRRNNWPRDNFTLKADGKSCDLKAVQSRTAIKMMPGPGSVIWVLASQFKIVISGIYMGGSFNGGSPNHGKQY
jgi:hypothetical protein